MEVANSNTQITVQNCEIHDCLYAMSLSHNASALISECNLKTLFVINMVWSINGVVEFTRNTVHSCAVFMVCRKSRPPKHDFKDSRVELREVNFSEASRREQSEHTKQCSKLVEEQYRSLVAGNPPSH